jgi:alpha-L-fucosidase
MKILFQSAAITITMMFGVTVTAQAQDTIPEHLKPTVLVQTTQQPITEGKFKPDWESLKQYQTPEWFKDAKFGIWAHWGPQCQPEAGDWYAREMYFEGSKDYKFHLEKYGHPSQFGFKDVINEWKAPQWNPEKLVALYKKAGAQYFFAMANHHDNLDMWDSKYHSWNSVNVGPKKDIIGGWAEAAKKQGLPFGVSIHAAHAWTWYEGSRGADKSGEKAGVPYDGNLKKEDGKGKWWEGLDLQELYAQNHEHSADWNSKSKIHSQWNWGRGASTPDQAYCDNFYDRTVDLINKYNPDLIYFDDTALPLWPVSDAGLKIASHFYNHNMKQHNGNLEAVIFGKILTAEQRKALVWDIERGVPSQILPFNWQTCTCIGGWHYDRKVYEENKYKSSTSVIQMLADIVSKNGNLLLNIPVRGDGSIDEKEQKIVEEIGAWMDINKESIFGTRPWKTFGEGPASEGAALTAQGFNEGKGKPFTASDFRFTTKDGILYAMIMNGTGEMETLITSLAKGSKWIEGKKVTEVRQLGSKARLKWSQTEKGLSVKTFGKGVVVLAIKGVI